jgi:exopolysaccharide biosynthesis polyprenyl glycosylphosphotransferase
MTSGWRYRFASVLGTLTLTAVAVTVANDPAVQKHVVTLPILETLPPTVLQGQNYRLALVTTVAVLFAAAAPLYKPRPRRILDTIALTQKRVLLGLLALAAIGYFDYTYRLPRTTLVTAGVLLLVVLPLWSLAIRRQPEHMSRAILIGDDSREMEAILRMSELPLIGYVSAGAPGEQPVPDTPYTDGGTGVTRAAAPETEADVETLDDLDNLGGLTRLQEVLVEYDIDTALLAFERPDRAAFFGTLDLCYRHGVTAMVHREHTDSVLTTETDERLAEVDLEPWDLQERIAKRVFDVVFSATALIVLAPVLAVIAAAIKLDSPGPVLYGQERTAEFGETFNIYKFRSMVTDAEADSGPKLSEQDNGGVDPRVTRVGHVLRKTHLDEIPQLWSILKGDMSVVGPRPERPELDADIEQSLGGWSRRWFVKPGLTGLAQINDVTGHEPARKLRYDIEYIRRQSFWFDLKVVVRQFWLVGEDVVRFLRNEDDREQL